MNVIEEAKKVIEIEANEILNLSSLLTPDFEDAINSIINSKGNHSLQQPNQTIGITGGRPDMIEPIARACIVNYVDGLFIETYCDPKNAKSDGANMLHLNDMEGKLERLVAIRKTINKFNL